MTDKLKQIIFKKLYKDLSHAEIICHTDGSIWFIDRNEKYWYLEFEKSGNLWWRWEFFSNFFKLFSMIRSEYEPLIVEWVEEVLNGTVVSPDFGLVGFPFKVEEVLNGKVVSPDVPKLRFPFQVEEVLNRKVVSPHSPVQDQMVLVEEVLNRKVVSPAFIPFKNRHMVKEVLNGKVVSSDNATSQQVAMVCEVLNRKVVTFMTSVDSSTEVGVEEVLKNN